MKHLSKVHWLLKKKITKMSEITEKMKGNKMEKRYVWFETSKGPEDLKGVSLYYLEEHERGVGGIATPEFGWWMSENHFLAGGSAAMREGTTKESIEAEYELIWQYWRPSKEEQRELLGLKELEE